LGQVARLFRRLSRPERAVSLPVRGRAPPRGAAAPPGGPRPARERRPARLPLPLAPRPHLPAVISFPPATTSSCLHFACLSSSIVSGPGPRLHGPVTSGRSTPSLRRRWCPIVLARHLTPAPQSLLPHSCPQHVPSDNPLSSSSSPGTSYTDPGRSLFPCFHFAAEITQ
jgi:hypothetical protein